MTITCRPLLALALAFALAAPGGLLSLTVGDHQGERAPALGPVERITLDARAFHVAAPR